MYIDHYNRNPIRSQFPSNSRQTADQQHTFYVVAAHFNVPYTRTIAHVVLTYRSNIVSARKHPACRPNYLPYATLHAQEAV